MKKKRVWREEKERKKKVCKEGGGVEPAMIFGRVGASWRNGFGAVPPVLSELH
jgi:hypothetical protein